jgi:type IV secretory pathway component VirB8
MTNEDDFDVWFKGAVLHNMNIKIAVKKAFDAGQAALLRNLPKITIGDFVQAKEKYDPDANNHSFEMFFDAVNLFKKRLEERIK